MSEKCSAHAAKSGRPCPREAERFTINGTCRIHHRAVRRFAAKRGWRADALTPFGVRGTATPFGVIDTWGSPLA